MRSILYIHDNELVPGLVEQYSADNGEHQRKNTVRINIHVVFMSFPWVFNGALKQTMIRMDDN